VNFLRSLKPQVKTGLLSNAWPGARKALTELYPCIDAFDVAVISAEVGLMKPFEEIYRLILHKLEITPQEAVFVDDMPVNVEAANTIGIHGIQFTNSQDTIDAVKKVLDEDM
jgi:HAD superfamily hydrolase (TIGR01509 family)